MTRGGGKAFVFGGPFVTGGGSSNAPILDLATWGTFSRSTEGSYITRGPTDGSVAFMAWAAANERRLEDRGDGNGAMLLLEGSSSNYLQRSSEFTTTPWVSVSGTADYAQSPDGTLIADRLNRSSASYCAYQYYSPYTGYVAHSAYVRATSGSSFVRICTSTGGLVLISGSVAEATATTTWQRLSFVASESAASSYYEMAGDTRDWSLYGGTGAAATDACWAFSQVERMAFPTSAIRTAGATATRGGDILSSAMGSAPSSMVNGRFSFDVSPVFSSANGVAHASDQCLFSFSEDDSERVHFYVSAGSIYIRVVSGGVAKVNSNALTFSAHQKLTIIVDGVAGSISVSGATTGNGTVTGTAWTRTTGPTLYIGNRQGASQPVFARLGRYIYAA